MVCGMEVTWTKCLSNMIHILTLFIHVFFSVCRRLILSILSVHCSFQNLDGIHLAWFRFFVLGMGESVSEIEIFFQTIIPVYKSYWLIKDKCLFKGVLKGWGSLRPSLPLSKSTIDTMLLWYIVVNRADWPKKKMATVGCL